MILGTREPRRTVSPTLTPARLSRQLPGAVHDRVEAEGFPDRLRAFVNPVPLDDAAPFRDTLAFGRAVLIASAPLIYTFMSELIKAIWVKPPTGP